MKRKSNSNKNGNKPPEPYHPLAWNAKAHDQKIESFHSEQAQSNARSKAAQHWLDWKKDLERAIKRTKGKLTAQDIIARLYDLQSKIANCVKHVEGMQDWYKFTMEMIEDHVGRLILTQGWKLNLFAELPVSGTSSAFSVPQQYPFSTVEELMDLKPLKLLKEKEDFIGLIRDGKRILGLYKGGELVILGAVLAIDDSVKRLPTFDEMQKELAALKKEKP